MYFMYFNDSDKKLDEVRLGNKCMCLPVFLNISLLPRDGSSQFESNYAYNTDENKNIDKSGRRVKLKLRFVFVCYKSLLYSLKSLRFQKMSLI